MYVAQNWDANASGMLFDVDVAVVVVVVVRFLCVVLCLVYTNKTGWRDGREQKEIIRPLTHARIHGTNSN